MKTFAVYIDRDSGARESWNLFYTPLTLVNAETEQEVQAYVNSTLIPKQINEDFEDAYGLEEYSLAEIAQIKEEEFSDLESHIVEITSSDQVTL